jgi:hypothetical protein
MEQSYLGLASHVFGGTGCPRFNAKYAVKRLRLITRLATARIRIIVMHRKTQSAVENLCLK